LSARLDHFSLKSERWKIPMRILPTHGRLLVPARDPFGDENRFLLALALDREVPGGLNA
jgi:hypothetical protein